MGTIQRKIGQVDEAVNSFMDALELDPDSGLALEGAGEAYLAQAHARTSEGLYTAAVTALRLGSEVTRRFLAADNIEHVRPTQNERNKTRVAPRKKNPRRRR